MTYSSFCNSPFSYQRRLSAEIIIGSLKLGGSNPVRLQSMTNTITRDIQATVEQCIRIFREGGEMVRITTPTVADVEYVAEIKAELRKRGYGFPLVTDVHFSPKVAEAAARVVEKVRINPGNYSETKFDMDAPDKEAEWNRHLGQLEEKFKTLLAICKEHGTALRIGVNHGSLSERIMSRYGDTPEGMVESALEFLRICKKEDFEAVVISMKASNVLVMIQAYRLLVAKMNEEGLKYPLHLGVTEAGEGEDGRIKSAVGIGSLLADGIGDTIRVSLTEDPELEIPVARKLVSYFENRALSNQQIFDGHLEVNPFRYERRKTKPVLNVGGSHVPVVINSISDKNNAFNLALQSGWNYKPDKTWTFADQSSDFLYLEDLPANFSVPVSKAVVVPYPAWQVNFPSHVYPLLTVGDDADISKIDRPYFLQVQYRDLARLTGKDLHKAILVFETTGDNPVAEMRACFAFMQSQTLEIPVILKKTYQESDIEQFQLKSSCDMGALLADGLGDGLWLENSGVSSIKEVNTTAFGILQATRTRISKTEFISCPSCGRTLFDLKAACARIRERTGHLKGLKIGVMGCIVNGPGEMADADYGYVGAGPGRITLYKQKEVVKKNIPELQAVDELIAIIKENGDWIEPTE